MFCWNGGQFKGNFKAGQKEIGGKVKVEREKGGLSVKKMSTGPPKAFGVAQGQDAGWENKS